MMQLLNSINASASSIINVRDFLSSWKVNVGFSASRSFAIGLGRTVRQARRCAVSSARRWRGRSDLSQTTSPCLSGSGPFFHNNLSGKYRVTKLSQTDSQFSIIKGSKIPDDLRSLHDGTYVHVGSPCRVDLLASDADVTQFFFPNGAFTDTKYELISYLTDSTRNGDSTRYSAPATALPKSETHGLGQLDVQGNVFGNIPPTPIGYVDRLALQREVRECLLDDRHPIVTLVGREKGLERPLLPCQSCTRSRIWRDLGRR